MFLTIPSAYALSKKSLPGRSLLNIYFLIPMYFSGGLIPTYLVIKSMQLVNRWYSLIFIGASSVYNMIVTRVYFQSNVPEELYESARIDGASEIKTFVSIAMPLVMPIVAVMTLFFAVARWNDYFNALVYVTKNDYLPLQMVLRSILLHSATALENLDTSSMDANAVKQAARLSYMAEAMKYALIIVASLPLLVAYPLCKNTLSRAC
ncbi:MAG: carbohydrate ABC transporter permease [Christensenellales bacterium]